MKQLLVLLTIVAVAVAGATTLALLADDHASPAVALPCVNEATRTAEDAAWLTSVSRRADATPGPGDLFDELDVPPASEEDCRLKRAVLGPDALGSGWKWDISTFSPPRLCGLPGIDGDASASVDFERTDPDAPVERVLQYIIVLPDAEAESFVDSARRACELEVGEAPRSGGTFGSREGFLSRQVDFNHKIHTVVLRGDRLVMVIEHSGSSISEPDSWRLADRAFRKYLPHRAAVAELAEHPSQLDTPDTGPLANGLLELDDIPEPARVASHEVVDRQESAGCSQRPAWVPLPVEYAATKFELVEGDLIQIVERYDADEAEQVMDYARSSTDLLRNCVGSDESVTPLDTATYGDEAIAWSKSSGSLIEVDGIGTDDRIPFTLDTRATTSYVYVRRGNLITKLIFGPGSALVSFNGDREQPILWPIVDAAVDRLDELHEDIGESSD